MPTSLTKIWSIFFKIEQCLSFVPHLVLALRLQYRKTRWSKMSRHYFHQNDRTKWAFQFWFAAASCVPICRFNYPLQRVCFLINVLDFSPICTPYTEQIKLILYVAYSWIYVDVRRRYLTAIWFFKTWFKCLVWNLLDCTSAWGLPFLNQSNQFFCLGTLRKIVQNFYYCIDLSSELMCNLWLAESMKDCIDG